MPKILQKLGKLRTNENVMIAIDVLYNSKSSFVGIFLMSFMIGVSIKNSLVGYLSYEASAYAFCGILCILLADIIRSHPVGAWRASMLFSITRVAAIVTIDPNFPLFPLIIGLLSGIESQLYWRPKEFLEVKEVSNAQRVRFSSLKLILNEITKIVMPFVLGLVISDSGYRQAANIILIISIVQVLLSILFRPTRKIRLEPRPISDALKFAVNHKPVRRVLWLQTLRGMAMTGCAYEIVSQLNVYSSSNSDIALGGYQSAASIIAIILLLIYRRIKSPTKRGLLIYTFLPPAILLPIAAILFPGNFLIAIILFIYLRSVIHVLYSSTMFGVYIQNVMKKSVHDDAYRIEIEILSELWLCLGRVLSIIPLLVFAYIDRQDLMMPLVAVLSFAIPFVLFIIRKSEALPTLDKPSLQHGSAPARRQ